MGSDEVDAIEWLLTRSEAIDAASEKVEGIDEVEAIETASDEVEAIEAVSDVEAIEAASDVEAVEAAPDDIEAASDEVAVVIPAVEVAAEEREPAVPAVNEAEPVAPVEAAPEEFEPVGAAGEAAPAEPERPIEVEAVPGWVAVFVASPSPDRVAPAPLPVEEPPIVAPPKRFSYQPRRSDVSELLAGFGVADSRSLRDISRELKRIADVAGTPCPPVVALTPPKKTAAR